MSFLQNREIIHNGVNDREMKLEIKSGRNPKK